MVLLLICSCKTEEKKEAKKKLNDAEKTLLKDFGYELTASLNRYEYNLVRNSWSNALFKERVSGLNKTEQTVFDHYFEEDFGSIIESINSDLVNKAKFSEGKFYFNKIVFYPRHAELLLTIQHLKKIDFWKYRVELINNIPTLTDYYFYRNGVWQSENIKNIIRLNARYTTGSPERHQFNRSLMESERYLRYRDSLSALASLYEIPKTHLIGNSLSLKRLNLASELGDSILTYSIEQELELNPSIYIRYLHGYYLADSLELETVFDELKGKLGISNHMIDSLVSLNYFWN